MSITNNFGVPLSMAVWLAHDNYDHSDEPRTISATSLLKPLKSIILGALAEDSGRVDVMDLVPSSLGTAIHTAIEEAWKSDSLKDTLTNLGYPKGLVDNIRINPETVSKDCVPVYMEIRSTKEIAGWKVSGKFDFLSNGMLEDFKSTGTYNYINQGNTTKYIQQASIYRWLNPEIVTEDVFAINYIFTDWSSLKARTETDYPKSRLLQQKFTLMPITETESFVTQKLNQINKYMGDIANIPDCTSEELWEKKAVFKYYKNPSKKDRSTKNFDSYFEASQRLIEDGSVGEVVEVKGEVVFCRYCPAINNCPQATRMISEGRLVI